MGRFKAPSDWRQQARGGDLLRTALHKESNESSATRCSTAMMSFGREDPAKTPRSG